MKKIMLVCIVALGLSVMKADAQYVRRKPGFSIGITIGNPGPPPYEGAVWVAPEWRWYNGRYVEVRGHWIKPRRRGSVWISGEWRSSRRGYRWYPGRWK